MRVRAGFPAFLFCALTLPILGHGSSYRYTAAHVVLVRSDNVKVHRSPDLKSPVLARLPKESQVVLEKHRGQWDQILIWGSVRGWTLHKNLIGGKRWESVSTYHAPEINHGVHASPMRMLHVSALATSAIQLYAAPNGPVRSNRDAGALVTVSGWQQDSRGVIWYHIGRFWTQGDGVRFITPNPGIVKVNGRPLSNKVSGKGMWLTLGTVTDNDPAALTRAALHAGVNHLYVEAAISPLGFHGEKSLPPLLSAAHRAGITVIAWIYPYLYDVASDIALTRQIVSFRTTSGQAFDGIAVDLERNMTIPKIRAYTQLTRTYVGKHYLMVGVTYPPQSIPTYPFSEVAHQCNVIAPMDYWHQTKTQHGLDYHHMSYGYAYARNYATDSIIIIRHIAPLTPIAPIGQAFDNFGRLELGPHAPSALEIRGFLAGSKVSGAVGVSFFQWMTTAAEEWQAINDFHY